MTKEEKQLLLVDLSARLPYGVKCKIWLKDKTTEEGVLDIAHNYGDVLLDFFFYKKIKDLKPYLRPMSSMTEKELEEYSRFSLSRCNTECFDWLNAHHFDYRGLIGMNLALEAPEGMY